MGFVASWQLYTGVPALDQTLVPGVHMCRCRARCTLQTELGCAHGVSKELPHEVCLREIVAASLIAPDRGRFLATASSLLSAMLHDLACLIFA